MSGSSGVLGFPSLVDEKAARIVAGGVVVLAVVSLMTGWHWLSALIAIGFLTRVVTGARLSLLWRFANRVAVPRLGPPTIVPGAPLHFAQAVGLALAAAATLFSFGVDSGPLSSAMLAVLLVVALMESVIGFCPGGWLFEILAPRWRRDA